MSVFMPNFIFDNITEITCDFLVKQGIKAIILDVDNTLTTHGSQEVSTQILDWLEDMRSHNFKMMIVSNNTKSRITPFAKKLGLPFVSMGLKPLTYGFAKAQCFFNLPKKEIMIIGDQIFTDVWGGNAEGLVTALVKPILLETGVFFKLRRKLEKKHINKYYTQRVNNRENNEVK